MTKKQNGIEQKCLKQPAAHEYPLSKKTTKKTREISQATALNDLVESSDKEQEVQEYANFSNISLSDYGNICNCESEPDCISLLM